MLHFKKQTLMQFNTSFESKRDFLTKSESIKTISNKLQIFNQKTKLQKAFSKTEL